jgi:glycosyltransferase involved in cell wall biosynthesis
MNLFNKYINTQDVFVINLKKRIDRKLLMDFKLKEMGIEYKLFEGEDGSLPENISKYNVYLKNYDLYLEENKNCKSKKKIIKIQSNGAYGIILSFKKLLDSLPENLSNNIVIFEDDIVFHNQFYELLEFYDNKNIFNNNDVVYFGAHQNKFNKTMISEIDEHKFYYTSSDWWLYGMYGVMLSPKIIHFLRLRLSDISSPTLMNIDLLLNDIIRSNNIKGVVLHENLVIPQLEESDNMGPRDIYALAEEKKWNLSNYKYLNLTSNFKKYYHKILHKNISFRKNTIQLDKDILNQEISQIIENKNKSFVFIIPSYNNSLYYKWNLDSVFNQKYPYWRIIYVDDASTDDTYNLVKKYIIQKKYENKITLIKNTKNKKQAFSRYIAYNMCQDDEICCMLDGDDALVDDKNLLYKLNDLYLKHNLLITYGNFYYKENNILSLSGTGKYSEVDIKLNQYRKKWVTQHMRTCEARLLKTIPKNYLKYNNSWIKCCTDCAEMWWVLELSDGRHMNTNFPTYIYNKDASLTYENSYYNTEKSLKWKKYRDNVLNYLVNYKTMPPSVLNFIDNSVDQYLNSLSEFAIPVSIVNDEEISLGQEG